MPVWPVPARAHDVPGGGRAFGASRPDGRLHAGVDLQAHAGDLIVATEPGTVVAHQGWRGEDAVALLLETDSGRVVLYGALAPGTRRRRGARVAAGDWVGRLGTYPNGSEMLHFELYTRGTRRNVVWSAGEPKPGNLVDPTAYLEAAAGGRPYVPGRRGIPLAGLAGAAAVAGVAWGLWKRS